MNSNNYRQRLIEMKNKLQSGKMSVMVGAGFSKNANSNFPSWNELLFDLVKELYEDEIQYKYSVLSEPKVKKEIFLEEEINNIIKRHGAPELVSKYINQKGYREAITTYIEDRLKPLNDSDNNDLILHEKLLDMPWNNVFTTNYDTLFEQVINNRRRGLEQEYKNAEKEFNKAKKRYEKLKQELERSNKENEEIMEDDNKEYIKDKNIEEIREDYKKAKSRYEKSKMKFNRVQKRYEIEKWDKENNQQKYEIVKDSGELALRNNKRLIKLHGTLRSEGDKVGFDGDIKKQYIISKEDYNNYPEEHEAFTQLMRIALLQESFCLIGFSGEDPNFITWISWVRDILERSEVDGKDEFKIYLLDVGNAKIKKDKKLFFRNHKICYIPLNNERVKEFLADYQFNKFNNNVKQNINNTLEFLSEAELERRNEYESIWKDLGHINKFDEDESLSDILDKYQKLFKLLPFNRIPSRKTIEYSKNFIMNFIFYLNKTKTNNQKIELLALLSLSLKSNLSTIGVFYNKNDINEILNEFNEIEYSELNKRKKKEWRFFAFTMLKEARVNCNESNFNKWKQKLVNKELNIEESNRLKYEELLYYALNFNYKKLEEGLKDWKPENKDTVSIHWTVKKAGLLSVLKIKEYQNQARNLLKKIREKSEKEKLSERLYYYESLSYVYFANMFMQSTALKDKVKNIRNEGFDTIKKISDYLLKNKNKRKIKPLGDNRYRYSQTKHFGPTHDQKKYLKSFQLTQLFIEAGLPFRVGYVNMVKKEEWFKCFKNLNDVYPYLSLFFSLQYSGNDLKELFLRRIGQEISYSDSLEEDRIIIFKKLKKAFYYFLEKHETKKRGILYLMAELINSLPCKIWSNFFSKFWDKFNSTRKLKDLIYPEYTSMGYYKIINKFISLIEDKSLLKEILLDLIEINDKKEAIKINYLASWISNHYVKNNIPFFCRDKKIQSKIKQVINNISNDPKNKLKILLNINELLTEENEKLILENIKKLDNLNFYVKNSWKPFVYFSFKDSQFREKIKSILLTKCDIWPTGIESENGKIKRSFGNNYPIPFRQTRKSENNEYGIEWDKKEVELIYDKLNGSLKKIKNVNKSSDYREEFKDIKLLKEMYYFLQDEKDFLKDMKNYNKVYDYVSKKYREAMGYEKLKNGLLSQDENIVIHAISELKNGIKKNEISKYQMEWQIVANKILFKMPPKLEACLDFFAYYLYKFRNIDVIKKYKDLYRFILEKYWCNFPEKYDKPFVEEKIIRIALVLDAWDEEGEYIDKWIKRQEKTRFSNIKNIKIEKNL